MRPLIVIRRTPKIDFMAWHKVGFALSLQSDSFRAPSVPPGVGIAAATSASAAGLLAGSRYTPVPQPPLVPDGATLLGLGTLLLGLAAAVRRVV